MKEALASLASLVALCLLAGCGELGPESETAQQEQLDQTTAAPGEARPDPFANPEPATQKRVPGE
jgi:predicted small lipoprotein YifL